MKTLKLTSKVCASLSRRRSVELNCETRHGGFAVESVLDDDCLGVATLMVGCVAVSLSSSISWYHVSFRTGVGWEKSVELTIALSGVWVQDVNKRSGLG